MVHVGKDGRLSSQFASQSTALNHLIHIYNANEHTSSSHTAEDKDEPSQPTKNTRSTALLLSGLRSDVKESDLLPLFGHTVSRIVQVDIATDDRSGQGLGYAHVVFEVAGAAEAALKVLGGEGSCVQVGSKGTARVSRSYTAISSSLEDFSLYIGQLPQDVTYEEVKDYLNRMWKEVIRREEIAGIDKDDTQDEKCPIVEIRLSGDSVATSGVKLRRYGLVNLGVFSNTERLMDVYQDQVDEKSERLKINNVQPWLKDIRDRPDFGADGIGTGGGGYSSTLGIVGLTDHVTEAELVKLFAQFGTIEGLKYYPMKHMAYLKYAKVSSAIGAKFELADYPIRGVPIRVQWAQGGDQSFLSEEDFCFGNNSGAAVVPAVFTSRRREEAELKRSRAALDWIPSNTEETEARVAGNNNSESDARPVDKVDQKKDMKHWASKLVEIAKKNSKREDNNVM